MCYVDVNIEYKFPFHHIFLKCIKLRKISLVIRLNENSLYINQSKYIHSNFRNITYMYLNPNDIQLLWYSHDRVLDYRPMCRWFTFSVGQ